MEYQPNQKGRLVLSTSLPTPIISAFRIIKGTRLGSNERVDFSIVDSRQHVIEALGKEAQRNPKRMSIIDVQPRVECLWLHEEAPKIGQKQ